MTAAPKFSLVLATYGRSEDIGRLVDSLVEQTERRFELIVVDQNPDERVVPYVNRATERGIEVNHLRLDRPNLSAARNRGLAVARGEWVAFPDDDCWYEPETLAGVLSASRDDVDGIVVEWAEFHAATGPSQLGGFALDAWRNFRGGDASSITLFFRQGLLARIGGFDERLGVGQRFGSGEETDVVLKALRDGATIERSPCARVHHVYEQSVARPTLRQLWRRTVQRARGTGAIYAKHSIPTIVIVRGLIAPIPRALLSGGGWYRLVSACATVSGRWQGWRDWNRLHRNP